MTEMLAPAADRTALSSFQIPTGHYRAELADSSYPVSSSAGAHTNDRYNQEEICCIM